MGLNENIDQSVGQWRPRGVRPTDTDKRWIRDERESDFRTNINRKAIDLNERAKY